MGLVGPFQGPIDYSCRMVRGRCPRLCCQRPFRAHQAHVPHTSAERPVQGQACAEAPDVAQIHTHVRSLKLVV
jgi:hypothetical protein